MGAVSSMSDGVNKLIGGFDPTRCIMATCNGRFDALPKDVKPTWRDEVVKLAKKQATVARKPVLAIWGGDVATEEHQATLLKVANDFLGKYKPEKLMISGRRAPAVAEHAEKLLRSALGTEGGYKPKYIITGGADGVDSVALRLTAPSETAIPGIAAKGFYTPTKFARADAPGKLNPNPVDGLDKYGITPGQSPLRDASEMGEAYSPELIALMEGQWEWRDTENADQADAAVAFLTADGRTAHDGTKATLNIFSEGRYAHPFPGAPCQWETKEGKRLPDVVCLAAGKEDGTDFVGYKLYEPNK